MIHSLRFAVNIKKTKILKSISHIIGDYRCVLFIQKISTLTNTDDKDALKTK